MKYDVVKLTERKEIAAPSYLEGLDLSMLNRGMSIGFFPSFLDGLEYRPWLPEFKNCCVTLILDKVLEKAGTTSGTILCCTGESCPVELYMALGTLEMQSSGITYVGSFQHQEMDVMVLNVDMGKAKKEIAVPESPFTGFKWYHPEAPRYHTSVHYLPAESLGGRVSLSFAVCGEFNLYMYFVKDGETALEGFFSKGFCCK